ncbi:MAG: amidohydrolase [Acidobacteria bacterium]|nr:amidohydrolase [Acidobacteriota bacterium]
MKRRQFFSLLAAGSAFAQGREFRKNPPVPRPASKRIIDLHVHTFFQREKPSQPVFSPQLNNSRPDGVYQINASWEQFRHDISAVDKAVILHVAQNDVGRKGNDETAAIAGRWPEKLVPFGSVNPLFPDALEEFERGVKQLALKGYKLSPIYQRFEPMDARACRIYARAEEWGIPLIFHTATAQAADVPLKWANPVLFDDVAYAFPRLKIIMAHLGHPWQRECVVMMRKHPNVYAELSGNFYRRWDFYQALLVALEWGQTHKILFGSDWPITTPKETIDGLRSVNQFAAAGLPRIPDEVIEGIVYRDSLKLLGIE